MDAFRLAGLPHPPRRARRIGRGQHLVQPGSDHDVRRHGLERQRRRDRRPQGDRRRMAAGLAQWALPALPRQRDHARADERHPARPADGRRSARTQPQRRLHRALRLHGQLQPHRLRLLLRHLRDRPRRREREDPRQHRLLRRLADAEPGRRPHRVPQPGRHRHRERRRQRQGRRAEHAGGRLLAGVVGRRRVDTRTATTMATSPSTTSRSTPTAAAERPSRRSMA